MSEFDQLARLLAAERAEQRPAAEAARGLSELKSALAAHTPALAVAHGPLKLGLWIATKWGVGAALATFGLVTASASLLLPNEGNVPAPASRPTLSVAAPLGSEHGLPPPLARPPTTGPAEPPERAPSTIAPNPGPATSVSAEPSTFSAELRLIKAAKEQLDAGHEHLAKVLLERHAEQYPTGVFAAERRTLEGILACRRTPGRPCQGLSQPTLAPSAADFPETHPLK
jgi:hypothetical protein